MINSLQDGNGYKLLCEMCYLYKTQCRNIYIYFGGWGQGFDYGIFEISTTFFAIENIKVSIK